MSPWEDLKSNTKPKNFVMLNPNAYLQNAGVKYNSEDRLWQYKQRKMSFAEYKWVITHEEELTPYMENINDGMDGLDVNDTTIMEAQADTFEQTLGIDDIMEALADIYTEILEIKESLA